MRNWTDRELECLYEISGARPGWLSKLKSRMNVSDEDEAYLQALDDSQVAFQKKLKAWDAQVEREGGPDIAFLETDAEKLEAISLKISEIEGRYDESAHAREPFLCRALLLIETRYERLIGLRNKIRARQIHTEHPEYTQLTEQEITIARECPLENLVESDRYKRIICPFHEDKSPSMWVKNGFGFCFVCRAWCDSIKYLMHIKGLSFVETVRSLSGMVGT